MDQKHGPSGQIKTSGDGLAEGQFEGWASTFGGEPDLHGDVIAEGAYFNTLRRKGRRFPLDWAHDQTNPIGIVEAVEKERGLWVKGTIALDVQRGKEAYSLLKLGAVQSMSIGYSAVKSNYTREGYRLITEIELFEISLVQHPANVAAVVERVKSHSQQQLEELLAAIQSAQLLVGLRSALSSAHAKNAAEAANLRTALKSLRARVR
jgi:uncharacterized protein